MFPSSEMRDWNKFSSMVMSLSIKRTELCLSLIAGQMTI